MRRQFQRWLWDTSGQDLVEYALLTGFLALAGIVGFNVITTAIGGSYNDSNDAVQILWDPPAPPAP